MEPKSITTGWCQYWTTFGATYTGGIHLHRYPIARPSTTTDILERCLALCPELAPAEIRAVREPTAEDLRPLILEEGCGFRPSRKGGVRLDVDWTTNGTKEIPVVLNYGYVSFATYGSDYDLSIGFAL